MSKELVFRPEVDLDRCVGHGRCYDLAPDLFEPHDDEGRSRPTITRIKTGDQLEAAKRAVEGCPESAITLVHVKDD